MNKEIIILKNISRESPGLIEDVLSQQKIKYRIIDLNQKNQLPTLKNCAAVIILGGPDSANDKNNKIINELNFIKTVVSEGIPYLGICLGMQLLVKSLDGKVVACSQKEIGFIDPEGNNFTVELTEKGEKDILFKGLEQSFNVFHLHSETVELTKDIKLLGTGKYCKNQIIKAGTNAYGIQSHFELTQEMLELWANEDPDLANHNKKQLLKNFKEIQDEYMSTGRQLFENFLQITNIPRKK